MARGYKHHVTQYGFKTMRGGDVVVVLTIRGRKRKVAARFPGDLFGTFAADAVDADREYREVPKGRSDRGGNDRPMDVYSRAREVGLSDREVDLLRGMVADEVARLSARGRRLALK